MTNSVLPANPERRRAFWIGAVKFLLLVTLTGLIFMLAQSMVTHRFFRGGWMNQNGTIRP